MRTTRARRSATHRQPRGPQLSHRAEVQWLDLVLHADFAGLAARVDVHAKIFFRQADDVFVGALLGNLHHAAANFQVTIGIFGAAMEMATRGSRRTFLSLRRPRAELNMMKPPSRSTQIGVTCGVPSAFNVARLPNAFLLNKSAWESGIVTGIFFSLRALGMADVPERVSI